MRISEKKKTELHNAIAEPIMKKRIIITNFRDVIGKKSANDIDDLLFKLRAEIWHETKKVLNIK